MKTLGKSILTAIAVAGVMFLTNPSQSSYVDYATNKFNDEIEKNICKGLQLPKLDFWQDIGKITANTCKSGLKTGLGFQGNIVKDLIANSTEHQNFLFLSMYTTKVSQHTFRTVGAFGNFFTFQK